MQHTLLKFLFVLFLLSGPVYAQNRTVSGTVSDKSDGLPLPGVSILVQGTPVGTQTSADGKYIISVPVNGVLVITSLGYTTQTLIPSSAVLDVVMERDTRQLTEVVLTGYGVAEHPREVTGAVSTIKSAEFENQAVLSIDKLLQGRAAGVVVQANNGLPGGAINVQIRGVGSFSASSSPLYIVDGIQLNSSTVEAFTQANPLAGLNTNDIESIEIIKDAATASIYGAQAANGVVLITTKKGKAGKTNIKLNYYRGVSSALKTYDVLNAQDYLSLRGEAYMNANPAVTPDLARAYAALQSGLPSSITADEIASLKTYDWQNALFRNGEVSDYELSAAGGNEKTTFYTSGSYNVNQAILTAADFKRGTFSVKLDHKPTDRLSFATNLNLSAYSQKAPYAISGSGLGNPAFAAGLILPTNKFYNDDGSYYGLPASGEVFPGAIYQNVLATNDYNISKQQTNTLLGSVSATYRLLEGLSVKGVVSLDYRLLTAKHYADPRTNDAYARKGYGQTYSEWNTNFLTTETINYSRNFNTDHKLSALAGFEYRSEVNQSLYGFGDGYPSFLFTNIGAAANALEIDETRTGYRKVSVFGRASYTFKGRYILTGVLRYDGSSRFGANNRYGVFPGISLAWNLADEPFLSEISWLNALKIRGGYGETGQDGIGNYAARSLFSRSGVYDGSPGIAPTVLGNPGLKWETATETNLGVDYSLLDRRISGTVNLYDRRNVDLLLPQPVLSTTGFTGVTNNAGTMQNRGIEVELMSVNIDATSGFRWESAFNFAYNDNKIKRLYDGLTSLPSDPSKAVGQSFGAVFTTEYAGVNPATGRALFYDSNGNLTYSPTISDRKFVGTTLTKYTGGFDNTFSFKGLSLGVFFQYQYGRKQQDAQYGYLIEDGQRNLNTLQEIYDRRWTTPGQITDVPRPYNGSAAEPQSSSSLGGTRFLQKTDYIKLREVMLAYELPPALLRKVRISGAKVYMQGTNLFSYNDFGGYDPEFYGTALGIVPNGKNITFGVQLDF
jgi:TonB-linked SusC/RagA family outer membrane protein